MQPGMGRVAATALWEGAGPWVRTHSEAAALVPLLSEQTFDPAGQARNTMTDTVL